VGRDKINLWQVPAVVIFRAKWLLNKSYIYDVTIQNIISDNVGVFKTLCEDHKVKYLYAFGSSVTDRFDEETSDIDLLVEIDSTDPIDRGETLLSLWDRFETFFNKKVDLLTVSSIRNPYLKKSIDSTKRLIYDGSGKEVFI
jgi:predicted nucleotidyltransferase